LLDNLPTGPADIVADLYLPLLAAGRTIQTVTIGRPWHDLGTPARYRDAALDWGRGSVPRRLWRGTWAAAGAEVAADALVHRAVLEDGARVERCAEVTDSLLLPGAIIGSGSRVRGSVIGPRVTLPAGSRIEDRLVHNAIAGYKPPADASIIGNRVYVPVS
jgi:mannose-1-phosphate guanylyltransferase